MLDGDNPVQTKANSKDVIFFEDSREFSEDPACPSRPHSL
jgi:hypothetical protein